MSLENKFDRAILIQDLDVKELREIYNKFLGEIKKREGRIEYQTHGLYAELPGNNKGELKYRSAIVFFRGYGSSGETVNQEAEVRNRHLESFVSFLTERNIQYSEKSEDFRTC